MVKIVDIFESRLFSFVYKNVQGEYSENEYDRLMDLWTDPSYLREYALKNEITNINQFVVDRLGDAEQIQDLLEELTETEQPLEHYFRPLRNTETNLKILSLQKGKVSYRDGLRLYAIKIDVNCFILTGGAIKMSQTMQGHPDTNKELLKLQKAQSYLKEQGVLDEDSFYELINELEDE